MVHLPGEQHECRRRLRRIVKAAQEPSGGGEGREGEGSSYLKMEDTRRMRAKQCSDNKGRCNPSIRLVLPRLMLERSIISEQ